MKVMAHIDYCLPIVHANPDNAFKIIAMPIKASPLDIEAFHEEITVKYPTFAPPHTNSHAASEIRAPVPISTSKLAQAYSPIPIRHHYEHDDSDASAQSGLPQSVPPPHPYHQNAQGGFRPMPTTPAPSPPPSPKPKKQQFQTDQGRPFLFPFSRSTLKRKGGGNGALVPFAIDEADKLYHKHMYVSLSLWQMWRTREECMTRESGLERMPGSDEVIEPKIAPSVS